MCDRLRLQYIPIGWVWVSPDERPGLATIDLLAGHETVADVLADFSHVWVISHLSPWPSETTNDDLAAFDTSPQPNPIGLSLARIVSNTRSKITVDGLDLMDGTPVLDLKPYVARPQEVAGNGGQSGLVAPPQHPLTAMFYRVEVPSPPESSEGGSGPVRVPLVRDVMVEAPYALPHTATVGEVRAGFENRRMRLMLLTHNRRCAGVLRREDIPVQARDGDEALWFVRDPATIQAEESLEVAHRRLAASEDGRLVVVDDAGRLVGLLCHNHDGSGFCNRRTPCGGRLGTATHRSRWFIHRNDEPAPRRVGTLIVEGGKALSVGDLLTLPPDPATQWLIVEAREHATDHSIGVVTVQALASEP